MRVRSLVADGLLLAFLVLIALATRGQVEHNLAAAGHGHGLRDRPVATRQVTVR